MRDEERRRRDRDDVDEHLRPGGPERDELVEAVPREARRASRLGEADGPSAYVAAVAAKTIPAMTKTSGVSPRAKTAVRPSA